MSTVVYSSELHQVIRNLKQSDPQEISNLFKDSNWFQAWSITAEEAQNIVKLFSQSAKDYIKGSNGTNTSWQ
ncbi:hypothetical protein [Paenibacillus agricola]|uniref:SnoaL-like protein n=1 Tax=Paenibacillus agricola TaxID=2716264 RepID=A0ABX0JDB9_9BACL|nr:hypothetical protein [Paenibacillus agricola]NHN33786.1 hypothetical protein [Paenibacillus agricola]